jgi:hypothetical protein
MSKDDLKTLQEAATQARTKADELKAKLTDKSSDEEKQAAGDAEKAATDAEKASGSQRGGGAKKDDAPDANESRTGFVKGLRAGEPCICPDGRKGTVQKFEGVGMVCIPNHDQSE